MTLLPHWLKSTMTHVMDSKHCHLCVLFVWERSPIPSSARRSTGCAQKSPRTLPPWCCYICGSLGFAWLTYDSGNDSWPIPELDFNAWLWTMNGSLGPQQVNIGRIESTRNNQIWSLITRLSIRVGSHTIHSFVKMKTEKSYICFKSPVPPPPLLAMVGVACVHAFQPWFVSWEGQYFMLVPIHVYGLFIWLLGSLTMYALLVFYLFIYLFLGLEPLWTQLFLTSSSCTRLWGDESGGGPPWRGVFVGTKKQWFGTPLHGSWPYSRFSMHRKSIYLASTPVKTPTPQVFFIPSFPWNSSTFICIHPHSQQLSPLSSTKTRNPTQNMPRSTLWDASWQCHRRKTPGPGWHGPPELAADSVAETGSTVDW